MCSPLSGFASGTCGSSSSGSLTRRTTSSMFAGGQLDLQPRRTSRHARVRDDLARLLPGFGLARGRLVGIAVAALLDELALGRLLGRLALVDEAGRELDADLADRRTVLHDDRDARARPGLVRDERQDRDRVDAALGPRRAVGRLPDPLFALLVLSRSAASAGPETDLRESTSTMRAGDAPASLSAQVRSIYSRSSRQACARGPWQCPASSSPWRRIGGLQPRVRTLRQVSVQQ